MKTSILKWTTLAAAVAWCGLPQRSGAASARLETPGQPAIVMENAVLRLVVDPSRGGAVVSYVAKATGREVVPSGRKGMGLFTDHFWGQTWPGELFDAPYESALLATGPDLASVKVWRTVQGNWGGSQKMLAGLVIEKTYTLRGDDPALTCHVVVRNPTSSTRLQAYWAQHIFWPGGDYDAATDRYFRPSTRGVVPTANTANNTRDEYIRDPLAGWSAALDTVKGEGLLFLMDYNDLDMLYNCGGNVTLEWMVDKIPVPAGRTWESDIVLLPLAGLTSVAHASTNIVAAVAVTRQSGAVTLTHTLRATAAAIEGLTLTTRVIGAGDHREVRLPALEIGGVTTAPRSVEQTAAGVSEDPLAVRVTAAGRIDGRPFLEEYFYFHVGGYGYGANVQQDLSTPLYKIARPDKRQELMRPETITRVWLPKPQGFVLRGLHSEAFQLDAAFARLGAETRSGSFSINTEGPRTSDFPFDYDALMQQDAVVVANASLECLGRLGQMILRDYLTHGGSLLLLGGKSAFGNGGLAGSGLEDLLPVEPADSRFDIRRLKALRLAAAQPHPAVAGLDWAALPAADYYLHAVKVRPSGRVLLAAGEEPFLVVGELPGGGRVACLLAAPYGGEGPLPAGAFAAPEWPLFMRNLLAWLTSREE